MFDSTRVQFASAEQAISYNFLIGKNLLKYVTSRLDAAFLIGLRGTSFSCPRSYLGYECDADAEAIDEFGANYGVVLTWTYKNFLLGARVSGESKQALLGYKF
jgi:hypothetical protein